ncbi:histidine phosphatase family protein [Neobacillus kokaensis]|uniref:Phosphoglycerate mutase n=1 Tax=Neobacillus kokaensis TaxID=2759023 RepID=A0ABQ3NCN9_9BACI|nr:histidine phosphatase family protein [Neobacillus kokaensis]GHI01631.1 phosphoglycerate mutase [Neobacillus kokaensis]
MEISLIRHGKSTHVDNERITCIEFQGWVEKYDSSGVIEEKVYPSLALEKIATANLIITSDLKRSIESASLLNPHIKTIEDKLYREVELPVLPKIAGVKLSPASWAVMLRCLWFCGYSRQYESLVRAKQRAKLAAEQLVKYTEEYDSVVLVGHGFFNRFIAEELKEKGWQGKRKSSTKHWHCTTYSLTI